LENIPGRDPWTGEIYLADVDASIGHVLIHFLHTGVYQTLNDEAVTDTENEHQNIVSDQFQTAVLALQAAKKYGVPGLQDLAQIELERRGEDMCLRDAVRAIREEFIGGPSDEHVWLRDFISMKVRWAFEHDPSAVVTPDFFDSIGSPTLTKLVAQVVVGLYSEEVEKLRKEKNATSQISATGIDEPSGPCSSDIANLPSERTSAGPNAWPTSVQKFGAFDDSSAAWGPHDMGQDRSSSPEADASAALPSSIEAGDYATEKGATEPWRLGKDKVETQHLRAEQAAIAQSQEKGDPAENPTVVKDEEDRAGGEPLWSSWGILAKKKKKSKVKKGYLPPPASPPGVQLEIDPTLVITDVATTASVVFPAQEDPEAKEDPYAWLTKSQTKKLKAKLDIEAKLKEEEEILAREAEEEAESMKREEEEADYWASFGLKRTKKKKSKLTETMGLEDQQDDTKIMEGEYIAAGDTGVICAAKDDDPWGNWGSATLTTKKKRKSKKLETVRLAEDEENEQICREKEKATAAATTADLSVVGSTGATFVDDDCHMRVEHLSQNYGWQNCRPCEVYMRKIAMKHHSEGLPIEDGFSTIS
jgi:hypothetical protein